jgi:hypothetical protein
MSLRTLSILSGFYDLAIAIAMLGFARPLAHAFGAPEPVPVLNAQLNGVFTLAMAAGYFWCAQDAEARRGFLWINGVLVKALGASLFVFDHFAEGSPASFLAFAGSDGALALLSAFLLLRAPVRS